VKRTHIPAILCPLVLVALFLLFLDIDACDFKSFDFYLSHFNHAFCLFTSIYNVFLNYASATAVF
jgi:hypothetical protein